MPEATKAAPKDTAPKEPSKSAVQKAADESAASLGADRILTDVAHPAIGVRARQFPSLFGSPDVEVAERTIDHGEKPTSTHTKDFVTVRRDWGTANQDEVHEANKRAVRQYMVSQGLRPDAKVEFEGEHDHPWDERSIVLRYTVSAVPAVVASDFDTAHTVVSTEDETATERAKFDAERADRLSASHEVLREGTPEADRPNAPKE